MEFIAVDVETANADIASICAIGLVHFREGQVLHAISMLINPKDHFDAVNIGIHGIRPEDVASAPTIEMIYPQLSQTLCPSIVVHHTHFDRSAFHKVSLKHRLPDLTCRWLDSSSIARRAWPDCAKRGYGLADLGKKLNITFKHHDATEDARAAGEVVVKAIAATGISLDQWLALVSQPIKSTASALDHEPRVACDGNLDGPLYGEVIAFTGRLSIERERAARLAAMAGCKVTDTVSKKTSLLVVGDQDIRVLNGHEKSTKQRKAEQLIAEGQEIRILSESDYVLLLKHVVEIARLTHSASPASRE
jgi:DNA polymerase-3 subunit epsilon